MARLTAVFISADPPRRAATSLITSCRSSITDSTRVPVTASIRRIPAAIELSLRILSIPMFPVFATCVPPHSSTEEPYLTTRTLSPYFSPNNAIAPISRASAIGISRRSSRFIALRILELTRCSTFLISSGVNFWK